jgi:hypothetical protein
LLTASSPAGSDRNNAVTAFIVRCKPSSADVIYERHCTFATLKCLHGVDTDTFACRAGLKRDGSCAGTRFRLSEKRTSPFESAGCQLIQALAGEVCTS